MILLTRLDGKEILLNERLFELVEETPDTVVTMQNGHVYIVKESLYDILRKIQQSGPGAGSSPYR